MRTDANGNAIDGIPEVPKDRIFFFNGADGLGGPETTTDELVDFIRECLPSQEKATRVNQFNYADYLETAKNSSNPDLQRAAEEETKLLK